jgi:NTE family protein
VVNAAYAWEVGVIAGMAEGGLDVGEAELFVGTSAGARSRFSLLVGPRRASC